MLTVQTRYVENRANQREQEQGDGNGKEEDRTAFCGLSEIFERFFRDLNMDGVDVAEVKFFVSAIFKNVSSCVIVICVYRFY